MKIYVAVWRCPDAPAGPAITAATEAALDGPWLLGGEKPVTHAFLVVEHGDGVRWRLDGQPGGADWSPCVPWQEMKYPTLAWEILLDPVTAGKVLERARGLDATKYNWGQIADQVGAGINAMLRRLGLPLRLRLWAADAVQHVRRALICTAVVRYSLEPADLAELRTMPDLIPERTGRVTRGGEGRWSRLAYQP